MADSQSIIALNIGSQRISMGVFAQTKKGLVLKSQGATSILADPATEAARIPQVQLAIKELAKSLKLAKQKTAYSLSGQSVFVRFVKLPPLEEENVDELVRFEAQQNVPFPIDEVVWDWQALKGGGIETEVILVAIKSDSLNDLNEVVAETGLGTRLVDAAPTALIMHFATTTLILANALSFLMWGPKRPTSSTPTERSSSRGRYQSAVLRSPVRLPRTTMFPLLKQRILSSQTVS